STSVTTSTSTSSTTTTTLACVCGDNILNSTPGCAETCDDGNTSNNDSCPADCKVDPCTPVVGTDLLVTVHFHPPVGTGGAGIQILLDYPEGKVSIPGSGGGVPAGTIVNGPAGASLSTNDLDHALRETIAGTTNFTPDQLFQIHFQTCTGAPAPTPGE